jgi:TM2 domain-containing membrane protein YozV
MKCANHPEVESLAFCGYCGRPLCGACRHEVRGMSYCENCLSVRLQPSTLPPIIGPGTGPNPGVALALGFIPGVGAIYNGQVVKAIAQVLIFGSLIAMGDRVGGAAGPFFGLGAAAFYFYMLIDSYQTAKRKSLGQPVEEWFGLGDAKMNAPIGAALLIGLGVLFLLDNLGIPIFHYMGRFWPILLILIGVAMLQKRLKGSGPTPPSGPMPPAPPKEGPGSFPGPQTM